MEQPSIEHHGDTGILTPPPEKRKRVREEHPTPPSQESGDTDYLREASKEDFTQSLRTIEFQEVQKPVSSLKEFGTRIDEKEFTARRYGTSFEVEGTLGKAEIAIVDELPPLSGYEEFRFYIARRIKSGETFTPETVVLAQHKNRATVYLAEYTGADAAHVDTLDEQRLLSPQDRSILTSSKHEKSIGTANEAVLSSGDVTGKGGEAIVSAALRRLKEKFFPEPGILKKRISKRFETLKPEAELIVPLRKFLASGDDNAAYIANPLTTINEKDASGNETKNVFWELVACKDKEQTVLLNLEEATDCGLLDEKQKLTALLHLFRGLDFLAKHGITHGDIKPKNLFLTDTTLKIGDFGVMLFNKHFMDPIYANRANTLESIHAYEDDDVAIGTPQFIHPRRYHHNAPETIHPKHDVFSAAMLAVKLLTGYIPPKKFLENFAYTYQDLKKEIDEALHHYQNEHPETVRLVALLQRALTESQSMVNPPKVEELLPAAEKFVKELEAMGVDPSLNIQIPERITPAMVEAIRRSRAANSGGTTKTLPR